MISIREDGEFGGHRFSKYITQHSIQSRKHLENIIYIYIYIIHVTLYMSDRYANITRAFVFTYPFDGDYSQGVQGYV